MLPKPQDSCWKHYIVSALSVVWTVWTFWSMYHYFQLGPGAILPFEQTDWQCIIWSIVVPHQLGFFAVMGVDMLLLSNTRHSMENAKRHGFTPFQIWGQVAIVMAPLMPAFVLPMFLVRGLMVPDLSLVVSEVFWAKLALAFVAVDGTFYLVHRHMHRHWPGIHALHHCVKYPSITGGTWFHPCDFALEFGSVYLVVLPLFAFESFSPFFDPWALVVTSGVLSSYYLATHDSTLKLHHYGHHVSTNTRYWVYVLWTGGSEDTHRHDPEETLTAHLANMVKMREQARD